MKRIILLTIWVIFASISGFSQALQNSGQYFFEGVYHSSGDTTGTSDVWGWTAPDGTDYAIIGLYNGTAFVRTSDMALRGFVPGPEINDYYYHRDIKTYGHYAYVVSEMNGTNQGIQIIDMSTLPNNVRFVKNVTQFTITSHNLSIDTVQGFAYVLNENAQSSLWMLDLADPENPVAVGQLPEPGLHDVYARDDTVWLASGNNFSVWDLTDKNNPQLIVRLTDPDFGYCHNIWPTDDSKYFVTTEETPDKTIKIWDMRDPMNTQVVGEYLGECDIAHNAHVMGDSVYISHYASGIKVIDITDKTQPVEVGFYDTYLKDDEPGFYGCWGAYPYTSDGKIYGSSFEGWLHVVNFEPVNNTSIEPAEAVAALEVFPNPFSGQVTISFEVDHQEEIAVEIRNLAGQLVLEKAGEVYAPGSHSITLDAELAGMASGMYMYRVISSKGISAGKLVREN